MSHARSLSARAVSCSPRAGGNSDRMATLFAEGFATSGHAMDVTPLRQHDIRPCIACYRCAHDPHGWCYLEETDSSAPAFSILMKAPVLFLSIPIFFYHVPAHMKAWIDRSQAYWLRREKGDEQLTSLPQRPAYLAMVAARSKGEKTFDGALLTLRYFLKTFNFDIQEPLLLPGHDGPESIAASPEAREQVLQYGRDAGERFSLESLSANLCENTACNATRP